jgi:hypothetical protein
MEQAAFLCFEAPIIGQDRLARAEANRSSCSQDGGNRKEARTRACLVATAPGRMTDYHVKRSQLYLAFRVAPRRASALSLSKRPIHHSPNGMAATVSVGAAFSRP